MCRRSEKSSNSRDISVMAHSCQLPRNLPLVQHSAAAAASEDCERNASKATTFRHQKPFLSGFLDLGEGGHLIAKAINRNRIAWLATSLLSRSQDCQLNSFPRESLIAHLRKISICFQKLRMNSRSLAQNRDFPAFACKCEWPANLREFAARLSSVLHSGPA
jgi:hypothetical protein